MRSLGAMLSLIVPCPSCQAPNTRLVEGVVQDWSFKCVNCHEPVVLTGPGWSKFRKELGAALEALEPTYTKLL